jgi:hypothetical protein
VPERLATLGALRPGVDIARAVDLFWFYFGYASYFTLHDDNGWSYEQAERWLADQACGELLSDLGRQTLTKGGGTTDEFSVPAPSS